VHDWKAEVPMVTTFEGIVIVVIPEDLNTEFHTTVSVEASPKVAVLRLGVEGNT
jgi:hypothetical protein